jgi:hypothetical protein
VLPKRNITKERYDNRYLYSDELKAVVADTSRGDIEYFGFEIEGTATRNIFAAPQP